MEIKLIYFQYVADFIWILPVFRQIKTKFLLLFLVFAIDDPIGYFTYFFITPNTYLPTITLTYLAFLSLFEKQILKTQWSSFSGLYILFAMGYFLSTDWRTHATLLIIIYLVLLMMLVHHFIMGLYKKKFSVTIGVIISYLFMIISRLVVFLIFDFEIVSTFSYFFNFIEIFIAIFFIIFRMDDDRFFIRL